jgi:hypothetical protein
MANMANVKTNPFTMYQLSDGVEVWLGIKDDPESEFVLTVHQSLVPALIATLRAAPSAQIQKPRFKRNGI